MRIMGEVVSQAVLDIVCDICKRTTKNYENFEYSVLSASWGYGSKNDGDEWEFHFCEYCSLALMDHIKTMKVRE